MLSKLLVAAALVPGALALIDNCVNVPPIYKQLDCDNVVNQIPHDAFNFQIFVSGPDPDPDIAFNFTNTKPFNIKVTLNSNDGDFVSARRACASLPAAAWWLQ